jgi:hypothetical protein
MNDRILESVAQWARVLHRLYVWIRLISWTRGAAWQISSRYPCSDAAPMLTDCDCYVGDALRKLRSLSGYDDADFSNL